MTISTVPPRWGSIPLFILTHPLPGGLSNSARRGGLLYNYRMLPLLMLSVCINPSFQNLEPISPAKAIYAPQPEWPPRTGKLDIQGTIVIAGKVHPNGKLREATIVRSLLPVLDRQALRTVRKWRFEPCTQDGKPIPCRTFVEMAFKR